MIYTTTREGVVMLKWQGGGLLSLQTHLRYHNTTLIEYCSASPSGGGRVVSTSP